MIFSGEFEHKLDKQGRLNIPSRYRTSFLKGIALTWNNKLSVFN